MGRLVALLLLIGIVVVAFGAQRGWFTTTNAERGATSSYGVTVDHDKIRADRETLKRQWESDVAKLERRMAELREQSSKQSGEAKKEIDELIEAQRPNIEAAKKRLENLEETSAEKWDDVKRETSAALAELEKGLERIASRFR